MYVGLKKSTIGQAVEQATIWQEITIKSKRKLVEQRERQTGSRGEGHPVGGVFAWNGVGESSLSRTLMEEEAGGCFLCLSV